MNTEALIGLAVAAALIMAYGMGWVDGRQSERIFESEGSSELSTRRRNANHD